MLTRTRIVGAMTATVLAGTVLAALPAQANSLPTPAWQPDANVAGGLNFYNASGNQITSGSVNDSPMAAYYAASGGTLGGAFPTKAAIFYSTPVAGQNSATWSSTQQVTAMQSEPKTGLPGSLAGRTSFVVAGSATDGSFSDLQLTGFPNASTTAGYAGLYEVRMYSGGSSLSNTWYSAVIYVSGTTWTEVWPTAGSLPADSTATALTVTPGNARLGTAETLKAVVTDVSAPGTTPAGTVAFYDNGSTTPLAGTVTQSPAGTFTLTTASLAVGSHSVVAKFTPTDSTVFHASQSVAKTFILYTLGVPTYVYGVPKAKAATVYWKAAPAAGSPVAGYQVQATTSTGIVVAGKTCVTSGTLTCTVTGLTNAVGYRFKVRARNALGVYGAYSALSGTVIPGVPTAVRSLTTTYPAHLKTRASWVAPLYNGGYYINYYQVRWSTNGTTWTSWANVTVTYAYKLGLAKGHYAWVQVRAHNGGGYYGPIVTRKFIPTI